MRPFGYTTLLFVAATLALIGVDIKFPLSVWWYVLLAVLYLHLLVLGAIKIRWNFYFKSYHHNPGKRKEIALTFDDGPAVQTSAILDVLKQERVPAAFFSIGKNAAAHPEMVQRWNDEGHLIGNHSYNHGFNFDWQSTKVMAGELAQTNNTIEAITGKKPALFRPPYGVTNPNLAKAVKRCQMKSIGWNIRSFDTTAKDQQQLLARILGRIRGGDIILLHDSMEITHQILTPLIKAAREKGFTFVRVDKLLDLEGYA